MTRWRGRLSGCFTAGCQGNDIYDDDDASWKAEMELSFLSIQSGRRKETRRCYNVAEEREREGRRDQRKAGMGEGGNNINPPKFPPIRVDVYCPGIKLSSNYLYECGAALRLFSLNNVYVYVAVLVYCHCLRHIWTGSSHAPSSALQDGPRLSLKCIKVRRQFPIRPINRGVHPAGTFIKSTIFSFHWDTPWKCDWTIRGPKRR